MEIIKDRINRLRSVIDREKLDAFYISGTDPHMSEYLPDRWKTREFITGFTGSYGEVIITKNEAYLWTDTRYFIQAEEQLLGTGIKMQKLRVPGAITFDDWLIQNLKQGDRVGINTKCLPYNTYKNLKRKLDNVDLEIVLCDDLLDEIWEDRPTIPKTEVFELDVKYAGFSRSDKFKKITNELDSKDADFQVISALDDLAWTFNLRGSDISFNPVFVSFAVVGKNKKALFIDSEKIPSLLSERFKKEGIEIFPYNSFYNYLKNQSDKKIYIDTSFTNTAVVRALQNNNEIIEGTSIPAQLKAVKNETELNGFKVAMQKDGVALVKFLYWLKNNIGKIALSEYDISKKLTEFRSEEKEFRGESFPPIVGYRNHGAIVHLSVGEKNANKLEPEGILLFDSGGHYWEGTTDITRTVALGTVTQKQQSDFTLVLKGLIALSMAKFPIGTKGCHLDILARQALWDKGLNYGHGTGHGVGHYLAVHEGPFSIRQEYNDYNIQPGMVMSNEPGIYREGEYGIRIENMIACVNKEETEFGSFLGFETLSLCPIDIDLIDTDLLTPTEKWWLNSYHKKVREILYPYLKEELQQFLLQVTREVV